MFVAGIDAHATYSVIVRPPPSTFDRADERPGTAPCRALVRSRRGHGTKERSALAK